MGFSLSFSHPIHWLLKVKFARLPLSLFSFPTTLTIPIIHQASPCRPGVIRVIHARNCKKKERFTSSRSVISAKWGAISRHMDNLIYLMESLFPHAVTFSIKSILNELGKPCESHFIQRTISTSQTGGWKLISSSLEAPPSEPHADLTVHLQTSGRPAECLRAVFSSCTSS